MDISAKLQLKPGQTLAAVALPAGVPPLADAAVNLNRDILAGLMAARDVQPVRQVAIDATWSALRFRPA
jgi:hypothetical protein